MFAYQSPLGIFTYEVIDNSLISASFVNIEENFSNDHQIDKNIDSQLELYFEKRIKVFNISIHFMKGTIFQKEVWKALLEIPYGETRSYEEIAIRIGRPKAIRAVGQACKKNPIGLFVPCHRVIGKDGSMRGYSGKTYIDIKEKLLAFERGKI